MGHGSFLNSIVREIEVSLTGRGACARVPIVQICTIGTT